MSSVELQAIDKSYGTTRALAGIDLSVRSGELLAVLGPNGAGKTTLLKVIAGLVTPDAGRILIGGSDVARTPIQQRGVSLQFQTLALFPDRSAYENIAFPLRRAGIDPAIIDRRVREVAERLRLNAVLLRLPGTFSGGEAQRVAIGRAIVSDSPVLLFDEPLSNLDLKLRRELRIEFRAIQRDLGRTVVYVTHDRGEALSLGDRLAVLSAGKVLQVATPQEILRRPQHRLVAELLSVPRLNIVPATATPDATGWRLEGPGFGLDLPGPFLDPPSSAVALAIVPQGLSLSDDPGRDTLAARVERIEFQGSYVTVHARAGEHELRALAPPDVELAPGAEIFLKIDPARLHVIDPETETVIG